MPGIMDGIAQARMGNETPGYALDMETMLDYKSARDKLHIRLCDPEHNREYLKGKIYSIEGDFAAVYRLNVMEQGDTVGSAVVTSALMESWGIDVDTLRRDAMAAEAARRPMLAPVTEMAEQMMFGTPVKNLLEGAGEGGLPEGMGMPLLCLTNSQKMYGAALALDSSVMDKVGKVLGGDFYVLPSSVHEVLVLPDNGMASLEELSRMVAEVNRNEVSAEDFLSDHVQHYGCAAHQLENADAWKRRMEAEKEHKRTAVAGNTKEGALQSRTAADAKGRPSVLDRLHRAQRNVSAREGEAQHAARRRGQEL